MITYTTHWYAVKHAKHVGKRMHQCMSAGAVKVEFRIHKDSKTMAVSIGRVVH